MAEHQSVVAPYFSNLAQQREANSLGMWVFLATEVMFFGGLFIAYAAYHLAYPVAFAEASKELDLVLASINTVVLLCSSLMMALGVHAAQTDKRKTLVIFLLLTILLGLLFLGIKAVEYGEKFQHNLVPGPNFEFEGVEAELLGPIQLFFGLYFATTGLHAIHMALAGNEKNHQRIAGIQQQLPLRELFYFDDQRQNDHQQDIH